MDYREKIMECIGRISDKERLELICRFAERLSEREGSHGTERGECGMKAAIIEMVNKADDRQIERLFFFIRAFLNWR